MSGTLTSAGVGMRPLTVTGQPVPVPETAITADIHQPLDIHRSFRPEGTLDCVITLDDLPYPRCLLIGKFLCLCHQRNPGLRKDLDSTRIAYSEDISQCDLNMLVVGYIDSDYSRHRWSPFVFTVTSAAPIPDAAYASGSCI